MKYTVETNMLKEAINKVAKGLPKKPSLPILKSLCITFDKQIFIKATDLEIYITSIISPLSSENNEVKDVIISDTKGLMKSLKYFKEDRTFISIDKDIINFTCGKKTLRQKIKDDDYPKFPISDYDYKYKYNMRDLKTRFNKVKYAVGKTAPRPVLNTIHFNENDIVTLDGARIASNTNTDLLIKQSFSLIPEHLKLCCDILDGNINIYNCKKYTGFTSEDNNITIYCRNVDGDYFDYKRLFEEKGSDVKLNKDNFIENLDFINSSCEDKKFITVWKDNYICNFSSTSQNITQIDAANILNNPIGFNGKYMTEALKQFDCDDIEINLSTSKSPILIKGREDCNNKALLLPYRIDDFVFPDVA